jgi:hypothetical protein
VDVADALSATLCPFTQKRENRLTLKRRGSGSIRWTSNPNRVETVRKLFLGLAIALLPAPAPAQTPSGAIVITGRVTQAGDTSVAVGGADITIVGTSLRRAADGQGRFRFADVPPGTYQLNIRSIGYEPASIRMVLEAGRSYEQAIELRRHPNALTEVVIEGRMLKVPARLEDVYARAAHEHGTFFTRQDIDKLNPLDMGSLLDRVPSVYMHKDTPVFTRCKGPLSGAAKDRPPVQVYIDGVRVTNSDDNTVGEALRLVTPRDIEAMEVYSGVARLPAEFLEDACAVIAIWTKSR